MLQLQNVCLTYFSDNGETKAIEDVSFEVKKGEFVAILGPSGCGKTTILSLISGLIKPTKGQILFEGEAAFLHQNKTGYMFQKDHLFEWRTVLKNVYLGLEIMKPSIKKIVRQETFKQVFNSLPLTGNVLNNFIVKIGAFFRALKLSGKKFKQQMKQNYYYADELLRKYGMWEFRNKFPNELSGDMRQRVALIRTLALNPDILLLDEPFSSLDYQTRLNLCDDVSSIIKNEQKTTILVTHDITEALSLAQKIIVLTKRPARIKSIYNINDDNDLTPLQRRESGLFLKMFDTIWKELQSDDNL